MPDPAPTTLEGVDRPFPEVGGLTVFHTSPDPAAILSAGFINGDGVPGLGSEGLVGVLLTGRPDLSPGSGSLVLAVSLPHDFDLDAYRLTHRADPAWCVPAEQINPIATVRLLAQEEVNAAIAAGNREAYRHDARLHLIEGRQPMSEQHTPAAPPGAPSDAEPASRPGPTTESQEQEPERAERDQFATDLDPEDLPDWTQGAEGASDAGEETGQGGAGAMEEVAETFEPQSGHDTGPARPD